MSQESTKANIHVSVVLSTPLHVAWEIFTTPDHILNWNFASDEWHCPSATNDLRPEGAFSWRMEAKDGSMGFDYSGKYKQVEDLKQITLTLDDGRSVWIVFSETPEGIRIQETFEIEDENSADMQRAGWQSILNNYKAYAESIWNSQVMK